jgi:magnesium transporter
MKKRRSQTIKIQRKYSKKSGLPPGTLFYTGNTALPTLIRLIQYDEQTFSKKGHVQAEDVVKLVGKDKVNWFMVSGFKDAQVIEKLGTEFNIHPLLLEDILNVEHLPKVEDSDDFLFVTLKSLTWNNDLNQAISEQVSIYLGNNFIVTFQETLSDLFDPIIERLEAIKGKGRLKQEDYLLYLLMDRIVDNYYFILDKTEGQIEELEDALVKNPSTELSEQFLNLKKNLVLLRRTIYPLKEEVRYLSREQVSAIQESTHQYLRDIHDHLSNIIQTIDNFREMVSTLMDLLMANNANRMNSIMKTLTVVSTIFIPLTFLAGVYGMNFEYFPELHWHYSYFILWGIMLLIGLGMFFYMKMKKWF